MQDLIPSMDVGVVRHPDTVLAEAALVAKSIDRLVRQRQDLVQVIGGRRHPRFELLQIIGQMFRVTARVRETRQLQDPDGWEATAEAVHIPTGQVIAIGDGMCTRDEPSWDMRPKYEWRNGPNGRERVKVGEEPVTSHQRRSMAQTRACSRALRLALGWVLGLAGYEATAAEELGVEESAETSARPMRPMRKSQGTIGLAQQKQLWVLAKAAGLSTDDVAAILRSRGYDRTDQIPVVEYEQICAEISDASRRDPDVEAQL